MRSGSSLASRVTIRQACAKRVRAFLYCPRIRTEMVGYFDPSLVEGPSNDLECFRLIEGAFDKTASFHDLLPVAIAVPRREIEEEVKRCQYPLKAGAFRTGTVFYER